MQQPGLPFHCKEPFCRATLHHQYFVKSQVCTSQALPQGTYMIPSTTSLGHSTSASTFSVFKDAQPKPFYKATRSYPTPPLSHYTSTRCYRLKVCTTQTLRSPRCPPLPPLATLYEQERFILSRIRNLSPATRQPGHTLHPPWPLYMNKLLQPQSMQKPSPWKPMMPFITSLGHSISASMFYHVLACACQDLPQGHYIIPSIPLKPVYISKFCLPSTSMHRPRPFLRASCLCNPPPTPPLPTSAIYHPWRRPVKSDICQL